MMHRCGIPSASLYSHPAELKGGFYCGRDSQKAALQVYLNNKGKIYIGLPIYWGIYGAENNFFILLVSRAKDE